MKCDLGVGSLNGPTVLAVACLESYSLYMSGELLSPSKNNCLAVSFFRRSCWALWSGKVQRDSDGRGYEEFSAL